MYEFNACLILFTAALIGSRIDAALGQPATILVLGTVLVVTIFYRMFGKRNER